jgi:prephenate dehydrogenase
MKSLKKSTIFIIGLGQIGGSIGLDLTGKKLVGKVVGYDKDLSTMRTAKRLNAVDNITGTIAEGLKIADIIILAVPIRKILKLLPSIYRKAGKHQIILDVGGTKSEMFNVISKINSEACFIGGHPIAGTENMGIHGAQKGLFKKTYFVLTPNMGSGNENISKVKSLIRKLGANPIIMTPTEHDKLIAATSHLPYALSLALMNLAIGESKNSRKFKKLIGGSFKSATRVAMSSPELTLDMCKTNQKEITKIIDKMIAELVLLKKSINNGNETRLKSIINKARKKRKELSDG